MLLYVEMPAMCCELLLLLYNDMIEGQTQALVEDEREGVSPLYRAQVLTQPPLEEALLQQTFWAETAKLYPFNSM